MTAVAPEAGIPRASPEALAGEVRENLAGRSFRSAVDLAVCDGQRLVGLVSIERLLAAAADRRVGELAEPAVRVRSDIDEELAAARLARNGGRSLAVVDDGGSFVGLLGAMGSAGIVAAFEEQLSRQVLLAFFIPAVVYMADAVGTQTEALVIRGISVGVSGRHIVVRELITGLVIGLLLGAAFFPFAYLVWGDARIAATVALALLGSTATATLVAMALPYALNRLGRDPAFGAGPLATVIQDLLSILIYFAIAVGLAG